MNDIKIESLDALAEIEELSAEIRRRLPLVHLNTRQAWDLTLVPCLETCRSYSEHPERFPPAVIAHLLACMRDLARAL